MAFNNLSSSSASSIFPLRRKMTSQSNRSSGMQRAEPLLFILGSKISDKAKKQLELIRNRVNWTPSAFLCSHHDGNQMSTKSTERFKSWNELIEKAKVGCDESLAQVLGHFESYLLMVAKSRIGSLVQAKFGASDIVQMSMMEVSESIEQFHGSSEVEIRAWLRRIVLNNLLDESKQFTKTQKRAVGRERSLTFAGIQQSKQGTPSEMIRRRETDSELKRLVDDLPDNQKRVIEGRHRFGLTHAQIGEQMGISEANARQLWSRAAKQLRRGLEED